MKQGRLLPAAVVAAALVILALSTVASNAAAPAEAADDDRPTTFSAGPRGARALFLVLERFLPGIRRLMAPLQTAAPPGSDEPDTLLVLQPTEPITEDDANALDWWLAQGGQLIYAADGPWPIVDRDDGVDYLSRYGFSFVPSARSARLFAGNGGAMLLDAAVLAPGGWEPLFAGPEGAVGAARTVGDGRIVVIADGYAWSNDRLARSRNAAWLVQAAGAWGNGRLLIDEYHLGNRRTRGVPSLLVAFFLTPWGFAFLQAGLAALLLALRAARRFGPAEDPPRAAATDPLKRLRGIETLLRAARARTFADNVTEQLAAARRRGPRNDGAGRGATA